jgi:H+/Cl- antiporter ClcA
MAIDDEGDGAGAGTGMTRPAVPVGGSAGRWRRLRSSPPQFRRVGIALGERINAMSYLPKWLILGTTIGIVAGLGAVVFYEALSLATHFFLSYLAGYHVPTPAGEGYHFGSAGYSRPWAIPLVVVLGGLLAGFIVFTWAPEAEGHGTDAAIDAVHHNPRGIRLRAVVVKIVASALTIGSGGSGGREGPTAQISAGFGSFMARLLDLSPEDGRIAVSIGIGSGIGAIFSAPLGGAVLAADIVYRDDFEYEALLPGVFASVIAYAIFGAFFGYHPLFAIHGLLVFDHPAQLLWFALLGVIAGAVGLLYAGAFYGTIRLNAKLPFTHKLRPALGALFVGLMALGVPQVLGTGYGWVQRSLDNQLAHIPLAVILLLPILRIVATSLSIGTGGSGGVFGPGMVIGAFTGYALWRLLEGVAPGFGHDPAPFVVVGMMAVFGSISRAPVAVMIMVAQMTGNVSMLAPAMVAVSIAWFMVSRLDKSIYVSQLKRRADSASGRLRFGLPQASSLSVADVATPPRLVLGDHVLVREAREALDVAGVPGAPVTDEQGTYLGTVEHDRLAMLESEGRDSEPIGPVVDATTPAIAQGESLDSGLDALLHAGGGWVPVTGGDRRVVGILAVGQLVRGYRRALVRDLDRVAGVRSGSVSVEERIGPHSVLAGRAIRDVDWPAGCVVMTVQHDERLTFAVGETELAEGDVVSALVPIGGVEGARRLITGEESGEREPEEADQPMV